MSSNVTVLTINGRRQNVKVEANTTLLEVLEIVCKKQNLDPDLYILQHHSKIVDLGKMYRFAGIANNALLEMEEAKVPRVSADVLIMIQKETGDRCQGMFKTSATLYEIIQSLAPESASNKNTVIIYMRREVYGEQLITTTLKNLGLSGGRAILRLVEKDPESLREQAHVSAALPTKEKIVEEDSKVPAKGNTAIEVKDEQSEKAGSSSPTTETEPKKVKTGTEINEEPKKVIDKGAESSKAKPSTSSTKEIEFQQDDFPDPIINIIGDREALVFSLESSGGNSFDEIPDDFFDITIEDIRKLYKDLRNKAQSMQDAPLITAKLRELDDNEKMSSKMELYKQTVIRIQFPDRIVLQGIFEPSMTFSDVKKFVAQFLADSSLEFHLYTTPPKEIVLDEDTLIQAKCVPQALIHFGVSSDSKIERFLKEDLYEKLSNASGASLTAVRARGLKYRNTSEKDTPQRVKNSDFMKSSVTQSKSNDVKIPKWFKTGK